MVCSRENLGQGRICNTACLTLCSVVVWRAKIGSLGAIEYVFEIHKKGSIKSLILNLQKASRSPTVQKVIAVSNAREPGKNKAGGRGITMEISSENLFSGM